MDKKLSPNFYEHEFACKCCGKTVPMNPKLIEFLEYAREDMDVPLIISSGYRCPKRNAEEGGVHSSSHGLGHAADIVTTSAKFRFKFLQLCLSFYDPIRTNVETPLRIGIGKSFIHVDFDEDKDQEVVWTYYK